MWTGDLTAASALGGLGAQVRALTRVSAHVDYDDPVAEAAHYALGAVVIDAVIATPARSLACLKVKAEALAWCHGGPLVPPPRPTPADRVLASLLADLTAPGRAWPGP